MKRDDIIINKQEHDDFISKYGIDKLMTRNSNGEEVLISELEKMH